MPILAIIIGLGCVAYGLLDVFGFTKNDISKDSDEDKKILSSELRYIIKRYIAGFQLIVVGVAIFFIGLVIILNK